MHRQLRFLLLAAITLLIGCGDNDLAEIQQSIGMNQEEPVDVKPRRVVKREVAEPFIESGEAILDLSFAKIEKEALRTARPEPGESKAFRQWQFELVTPKPFKPVVSAEGKSRILVEFLATGHSSPFAKTLAVAASYSFHGPEPEFKYDYFLVFELTDENRWEITSRRWAANGRRIKFDVEEGTIHADFLDWLFSDAVATQDVPAVSSDEGSGSDAADPPAEAEDSRPTRTKATAK